MLLVFTVGWLYIVLFQRLWLSAILKQSNTVSISSETSRLTWSCLSTHIKLSTTLRRCPSDTVLISELSVDFCQPSYFSLFSVVLLRNGESRIYHCSLRRQKRPADGRRSSRTTTEEVDRFWTLFLPAHFFVSFAGWPFRSTCRTGNSYRSYDVFICGHVF